MPTRVRSLVGRARRRVTRQVERRRRLAGERELIIRSGLFDQEWVEAQLGRSFATVEEAVDAYLADDEDCSPHPLFFSGWFDPVQVRIPANQDPLAWYLRTPRVHRIRSPHPLVDLDVIGRTHGGHPQGPLAAWVADLTPDTPLPVPPTLPQVTWGATREASLEAVRRWHRDSALRTSDRMSRRRPTTLPEPQAPSPLDIDAADAPVVSIVMPMWNRGNVVRGAIESVQAQTWRSWELIVVDDGSDDDGPAVVRGMASFDPRIRYVHSDHAGVSAARNHGLAQARGAYVAFLDTDNSWRPGFLQVMLEQLMANGWEMAHAALQASRGDTLYYRAFEGSHQHLLGGNYVDLNVLVARAEAVREVGGFDEGLRRGVDYDLVLNLAERYPLHLVPYIGVDYSDIGNEQVGSERLDGPVRRRPRLEGDTIKRLDGGGRISTTESSHWLRVVRSKHLARWDEAVRKPRTPGLTSVVLSTRGYIRQVVNSVLSFAGADDLEVVLVLAKQTRWRSALIETVAAAVDPVRVVSLAADRSPAVTANVGLVETSGEFVVLALDPGRPGPEAARLLAAELADEQVSVVQPALLTRSGLVDSAGAVFARGSVRPQSFLRGHSARDVLGLGRLVIPAAYGSVVAVRAAEALAARGVDPLVGESLACTDLSLRMTDGGGETVLLADAVVRTSRDLPDRVIRRDEMGHFEARHRLPAVDSTDCWRRAGFEIGGYTSERVDKVGAGGEPPLPQDHLLLVPHAVVRPAPRIAVTEHPPSLRWTIDLASPDGVAGERWGDTHFGHALGRALERLGQHVSVDNRRLRHRSSRDLDDVLLVLRGLDEVEPRPGLVNLEWIISHPELVTAAELRAFDRVYAASVTWPGLVARKWGVSVQPLLQATDPALFSTAGVEFDTGAEVLFVGNARRVFRPGVRHALAIGADLELHGDGWEQFVEPRRITSSHVDNTTLAAKYGASGVVLNDHWEDMRKLGFVSNRLIDAAASGARVASDVVPDVDLTAMFHGLVQTWSDEADLHRIIDQRDTLYPGGDERRRAAEAVAAEHSFDARARTFVDDAARLLRERGDGDLARAQGRDR